MKKNKRFVWGMAAVALTFMVLAGCSKKEAGAVAGAANVAANVLKSLPAGAIVASKPEDFKYDLTADGNGIVIQGILVEKPIAVIVPAEIEGYPVVEFVGVGYNLDIISITLPDTITKLGERAFFVTKITEFAIPPKLTERPDSCFRDTKLTSITLPEGITKINNGAFSSCESLSEVTIPESVTEIELFAFADCPELTKVNLPSHPITYEASPDPSLEGKSTVFNNCPKLSLAARKAITASGYTGMF